ncbi:zinc finger protein GAI-ASSOCIATED FACTOR 1-like [Corylus avellana]|uniref:zinc finger protein GAI-ASSOCIATED FACTOR 1-like n=1 Tax=Corylus avellana TaxID=13451 RepID=UPI00286CB745|nr:zinc finger protein GAI-ASSOCIATED FACTOR 1-like [Corylus avellana]
MVELDKSSPMTASTASGEASISSSGYQTTPLAAPPPKKKRNLPGMPDPDAEVIALSPKTLMATNRFVCEICNKGFQRDQNLQLHRRGHNLPWKLKQRTGKEIRKRVYVCPEPSCVHHSPARALGDLTGIKKHFCRKHGEKKWKCERCSKKYAVQSDWKAHMKTCGTREYKCDCGTMFSRRDSFITHRAFCDALAEESARTHALVIAGADGNANANAAVASPPPPPLTPSTTVVSPALSIQSSELPENPIGLSPATAATTTSSSTSSTSVFASVFAPSTATAVAEPSPFSNVVCATTHPPPISPIEPPSLSLSTSLYLSNNGPSLFPTPNHDHLHYAPSPQPVMSATALLQKAAQMGSTASNASLLRGLGLAAPSASSSSPGQDSTAMQWNGHGRAAESTLVTDGLGLGLPSGGSSGLMGQPMTRDLLGLSIGSGGGASTRGLSALLNSFGGGGGFDVAYGRGGDSSAGDDKRKVLR